jgi:hypothetical protein
MHVIQYPASFGGHFLTSVAVHCLVSQKASRGGLSKLQSFLRAKEQPLYATLVDTLSSADKGSVNSFC